MGIGDWGLGIGDWGLGIGDWAQSPIPNPQSPIPNPHCPLYKVKIKYFDKIWKFSFILIKAFKILVNFFSCQIFLEKLR